jgi:hypothetical protein
MGKKSSKKLVGHPDLQPGEQLLDACYGLGKGTLRMADLTRGPKAPGAHSYAAQMDGATGGASGAGAAAEAIDRNGILAFTDQRLLFLPVKLAVTKPKAVAAAWRLEDVAATAYERPMLTVTFVDGSVGGIHCPAAEKPKDFVAALDARLRSTAD